MAGGQGSPLALPGWLHVGACVCVCLRVCACVGACVCACVGADVCAFVGFGLSRVQLIYLNVPSPS